MTAGEATAFPFRELGCNHCCSNVKTKDLSDPGAHTQINYLLVALISA